MSFRIKCVDHKATNNRCWCESKDNFLHTAEGIFIRIAVTENCMDSPQKKEIHTKQGPRNHPATGYKHKGKYHIKDVLAM